VREPGALARQRARGLLGPAARALPGLRRADLAHLPAHALVAWLLFRRVFQDPTDLDLAHLVGYLGRFTFLSLLIVAAYVDLRHRIVPDQTSIYAVPVGIAFAAAGEWLGWDGFGAVGWRGAVLGATVWGGSFALFSLIASWIAGREALGWGDVKLVAMFGAFLGAYPGTFVAVLLGSLVGAIVGLSVLVVTRRRPHLPFAPPLAVGAATWVLWGDVLLGGIYR
jgi:prepilin signal peptidase PulO-like enzyme (type II secretory pathway)